MTRADQIRAVAKLGFTERQAGFLVTVLVHAGVCVGRQYCVYAGIVRGQKVHDFFSTLVAKKFATPYTSAHRGARLYHVQGKTLYSAVGEPDNRNRRPTTLARAIERLMLLDAVLAESGLRWLGTEREKVEYFQSATTLRSNELPHLGFGVPPEQTVRHFPDKLPIGVAADGRTHLFLYLVNRRAPVDFRAFLHRHVELLRALPGWELRLLTPQHLAKDVPAFEAAARQELAMPLRLDAVDELSWFFNQQLSVETGSAPDDCARFGRAHRRFHAPRYRTLYRLWKKQGNRLLHGTVSPVRSTHPWLTMETTGSTALSPGNSPPTQISTHGEFNSPRGCRGTFGSVGTAEATRIDADFTGTDCQQATFTGRVVLTKS